MTKTLCLLLSADIARACTCDKPIGLTFGTNHSFGGYRDGRTHPG